MRHWRWLPWFLVLFRLVLGPVMLLGAVMAPGGLLVLGVVLAVLSDIFDGVIARRIGCATHRLRQADSVTDLIFWMCVAGTALRRAGDVFADNLPVIAALLLSVLACQVLCLARFGRPVATHTYFAKSWALVLMGCFAVMFLRPAAWPVWLGCLYGLAANAEVFLILLRARRYPVDVKGFLALPREAA